MLLCKGMNIHKISKYHKYQKTFEGIFGIRFGRMREEEMKEKITLKDLYVLVVGMFIVAVAVYYFLMPGKIAIGSMSGFLMVVANFVPLPMSTLTFIMNAILLVLGFLCIGKEFGAKTVISAILLPLYLRIFEVITPNMVSLTGDQFLDACGYVLLLSFGQAMLFNINASSGGLDIVAKILNKFFYMELGKASALAGYVTAMTSILVYDTKTLIVSLIGTYMGGVILDSFINGFHTRKRVCVISKEYEELARYIVYDLNRGATLYEAFGGISNEKRMEIVSVLEKYEYAKLIQYVRELDPAAFITVSSVNEVIGNWNDNEKRNKKFK